MERYNIFYQVHKGLRALLYETAQQLQQTDFDQVDESDELIASLSEVTALFEKHAETEDRYILEPLEALEPAVSSLFGHDHEKDHLLGQRINSLLVMLRHTAPANERNQIGSAIRAAYVEFLVFNLEHMASEESTLNNYLWKHFSDEQLHGITLQIISQMPADYMGRFNRVMMRGLSNSEIIAWLQAVRASAPQVVYESLLDTAARELAESRYQHILQSLRMAA